jgi:hypothetical protein
MKAKILRYVDRMACRTRYRAATHHALMNRSTGQTTVTARRAPSRGSLRALWQRSPLTGRLEMHWQVVPAAWEDESAGHPAAA